ncbi:hypothetical protein ACFPT7_07815 [Acidicapsa dinghuensis]|uniref:Uncharacterized protein n=1 Tax=Acidicapsa dinghuensis TaxID=2218256 RepID=A0ABW1EG19_9BACT|nr:hypothetical protein [Acidicapsa dinghuensis]
MKEVSSQVHDIGDRPRGRPPKLLEFPTAHSGNSKSHSSFNQDLNESRILSALPLIAMASVFNLTTSDAFAFPETILDLGRKLSGFAEE